MSEQESISLHLKALVIHDANNTVMTLKECADFLKCSERTVKRRIESTEKHNRIFATYNGGWRIPKMQFLSEVVKTFLGND